MRFTFLLIVVSIIISSCNSKKKSSEEAIMKSIADTYYANLPCADCEAINYQLKLEADGTFEEQMIYTGESEEPFTVEGSYSVTDSIVVLSKEDPGYDQFSILPGGKLMMLDVSGERIDSNLEDTYILSKEKPVELKSNANYQLHDIWALDSLNGKKVEANNMPKGVPTLEIFVEEGNVLGFGGCNNYRGAVKIKKDSISFSQLMSTKMACPGDQIETEYLAALSSGSFGYIIRDLRLNLTGIENKLVFRKVD